MTRVLVADDHPLMREGIRRMLATTPGMRVVGEAGDGVQLLELLPTTAQSPTSRSIRRARRSARTSTRSSAERPTR
jgi:DNA-binding NarL/FixJ family response regulator